MTRTQRRLPPLENIVAFESAARLGSFTRAAEELHLSQAAVSRQIQKLEESLGVPLFLRRHKEVSLSSAGKLFQNAVGESIATIQRCVNDIERLDGRKVTVAASLGMSSFWLMPAILAFQEQHPEIDIRVLASDETCDLQRDPVDFAIQYGDGHWPGITAIEILEEVLFPVCSPQYLQQRGISRVEDITQETLIDYDKSNSRWATWEAWLKNAGMKTKPLHIGLQLSHYDLVYRAVCAGHGIGISWSYAIPMEARDQWVVRPMDAVVRTGCAEYLVYPKGKRLSESAQTLLDWLVGYAESSVWK